MTKVAGSCLCGAVSVSFDLESEAFNACHCSMCRKWSGGPALSVDGGKNVVFEGKDNIKVFGSSPWAERGFCEKCGTHLFYRMKDGSYINFPLGLLSNSDHFKFETQIFIDAKPACYAFANKTETMTEAQVLAKYLPQK